MALDVEAVLQFSRELQRAVTAQQVLVAARAAVRGATPYRTVWLTAIHAGPPAMVEPLAISSEVPDDQVVLERLPPFPVAGDPMLEEIVSATRPVVVDDARTDPRTDQAMVARLGNRTIINVPLLIGDELLGTLGIGTFHPEPPRPPTPAQLEQLVVFGTQVAAAYQRIRMEEARQALQRQLQAAQRLESLALLAGGVAHDFNNLLTAILNGLAFVAEGPLSPAQREDLDGVAQAAGRAADLTRQLLAMGRRQPLRLTTVDLAGQLGRFQRLLRRLIPESISLTVEAPAGLPPVLGDEAQLDQVLMNLSLNARDAMPEGGTLTLRAEVERRGAAAPRLCLIVRDTGHGMSPEVVARIFEPFFTTKASGRGSGIGLAVAAGIVEQHGGTIECTSAPGAGTTFRVFLPIHAGGRPEAPAAPPGSPATGTERILLAEDEPAVRLAAARVLEGAGYRVVAVADGAEAVEAARQGQFDLVVLDAIMPRGSGREAWERIRQDRPRARFLVVSGHAAEVFPPALRSAMDLPFLAKPFLGDDLLRAVRSALDREPEAPRPGPPVSG